MDLKQLTIDYVIKLALSKDLIISFSPHIKENNSYCSIIISKLKLNTFQLDHLYTSQLISLKDNSSNKNKLLEVVTFIDSY